MPTIRSPPKRSRSTYQEWSTLPNEIWSLIFEKLPLEDFIRCSSVWSCWSYIIRDTKVCSTESRVPWIVIRAYSEDVVWRFFDIANNKIHRIHLPELSESIVHGCTEGWLIVSLWSTANLRLFNPFTRAHIQLPPTTSFPGVMGSERDKQGNITNYHIQFGPKLIKMEPWKVIKCYFGDAFLTPSNGGYMVVVQQRGRFDLAFTKTGDRTWSTALQHIPGQIDKCTFFNGIFHAIDLEGRVVSLDLNSGNSIPSPPRQVSPRLPNVGPADTYLTVLPGSDELLLIYWLHHPPPIEFLVFRPDRKAVKWVEVRCILDGHSLFFAEYPCFPRSCMMCLSVKDLPKTIKENCMYMIDHCGLPKVWNMENRRIKPYHSVEFYRKELGKDNLRGDAFWINPVLTSFTV